MHLRNRLALGLCILASARAAPSAEPPGEVLQLPAVKVTETAPLQKQAEFQLREARYGAAAVSLGDYIYVIGGSNDRGTPLDSVERFDPRTGRSEEFARLKVARRQHRAVVVDGKIYVLGGSSYVPAVPVDAEGHALDDPDEGSTGAGVERAGSFMVPPRHISTNPLEFTVEVIDPATRSVTFAPSMPMAKARFSCATIGGLIYVIGGIRQRGDYLVTTNTTEVFDPRTGHWAAGVNMPTPRQSDAAAVGDFIVVAGGRLRRSELSTVESYFPAGKVWRRLPALAETANPSSVVFLGHQLYLFGVAGGKRIVTYDLVAKVSRVYPLAYEYAQYAATVVHDGKIFLLGGAAIEGQIALSSIQVFAPPAAAKAGG